MANALKFLREVKQEGLKVTWPTRKETTITTVFVFIVVFLMSMILLLADSVISTAIEFILGK